MKSITTKKSYTLNRFYNEAKALIEQHNCIDKECIMRVQFEIYEDLEKKGSPKLNCKIIYEKDNNSVFFSSQGTPEASLLKLEEKILESKEKWPTPENLSVDPSEELIQTGYIKENAFINANFENMDYVSDLLLRIAKLGAKLALQDAGVIKSTTTLAEIKKLYGANTANEARHTTGIKWTPIGKGGSTSGVYCLRSEFEKFLFAREFDFYKK